MKFVEVEIPEKEGYILSLGDTHVGDETHKGEGEKQLKRDLNWVKEHPNARVFLNGDIFNVVSRVSKTNPFTSDTSEYDTVSKLLKPYAKQFIGINNGNHCSRMLDMFGVSPVQWLAKDLNIPYCEWSAVVNLKLGKRPRNRWHQNYWMYFHHGSGGGSTIGGKANSILKLRNIIEGMDVYFSNHTHQILSFPVSIFTPSSQVGFKERTIYFVNSGGYLAWNKSYAEEKAMAPGVGGTPKVKFNAHGGAIEDHKIEVFI